MKFITLQSTIDKKILEWANMRSRPSPHHEVTKDSYRRLTALTKKGFGQPLKDLEEINGKPLVLCICTECHTQNVDLVQIGGESPAELGRRRPTTLCKKCVNAAANLFT